jgi:hypothetical protein
MFSSAIATGEPGLYQQNPARISIATPPRQFARPVAAGNPAQDAIAGFGAAGAIAGRRLASP